MHTKTGVAKRVGNIMSMLVLDRICFQCEVAAFLSRDFSFCQEFLVAAPGFRFRYFIARSRA